VLLDEPHGLAAIRGFQYDGVVLQHFQDFAQSVANEDVVIDH
jgi:hypothetical protein